MMERKYGEEHPYWPLGPFKVRFPLIHYRWEWPETIQALIIYVISLGMIPLLESYLGIPYEVGLAFVVVAGIGYMMPNFLGVPFVPGWITPAIPVVLLFLTQFEPGPEAIRALVGLQLVVTFIFLLLGFTGLGSKLIAVFPDSIKAGILMGAGIAAISGEIVEGGRLANTPISLIIGFLATCYVLFSLSFRNLAEDHRWARIISSYGMVPGALLAMAVGWIVGEYPLPDIEWGFTEPAFGQMWAYLPFSVGFPEWEVIWLAIPTAIIAYVIAFGDIVVGQSLIKRVDHLRPDEKIEVDINRVHIVTGLRNLLHSFFAPYPGLAGPLFTGGMATIAERYKQGRKAMDTIYSGAGVFWVVAFIALFLLPLVTFFKPVLPIALSITLLITGYLCISVGVEQINNATSLGVAGVMGVVLAEYGAMWGLATGVVLYLLLERGGSEGAEQSPEDVEEPISIREEPTEPDKPD
ncbi:MAG: solute carrier family 23 protein [Pseudomonadota bacterium]